MVSSLQSCGAQSFANGTVSALHFGHARGQVPLIKFPHLMDIATIKNNFLHGEGYTDSNGAPVSEMRTRLRGTTEKLIWMSFVVFFSRGSSALATPIRVLRIRTQS
jgi:hypothetical protein